jgi:hypothetical protein
MDRPRLENAMERPLAFHYWREHQPSPARLAELLQEAKAVLLDRGMASMDEYGDMLKWGLHRKDGKVRSMHVYHPDWCSFSDKFRGTIHYHGGAIRGTLLLGQFEHSIYEAKPDPQGDRFHLGQPYRLTKHTRLQSAGTTYDLPAMVPHWLKPTRLTLTSFEEEDNGEMGDLVNPASDEIDDHLWTQEQADALLPELLMLIDEKLAALKPAALTLVV